MESKKYMGVDYGEKRVGIALSDASGAMAFPKEVLSNDKNLFDRIAGIIKTEEVSEIVIGESRDYKGEPNPIMSSTLLFKERLEKELGLTVHMELEYMTTMQAKHLQGKNEKTDASAAAIILQSFLDKNSDV